MSLAVLNLVQMLHYLVFTIQLALLRVFSVKVKNLVFDTSKIITNAWFSMELPVQFVSNENLVFNFPDLKLR